MGDEIITALNDVSLSVAKGEFLCVLGTSGSGKTTLLHITSGLERPTSGAVCIGSLSLTQIKESQVAAFRRKYMGFIFQSYNLVASLTSLENVTLPLIFDGVSIRERERRAREILTRMGLAGRLNNKPNELSGGQQ